jgi:putative inorganic carbon (HCO3(-)) transporter
MALRDLALFALIFGMVPVCLVRPFVGILVYSWIGYMNVHRLTWGMAYDFPFAQLIALVTLLGCVVMVIRESKWPRLPMERETILLLLLWSMFTLTTFTALLPQEAWPEWQKLSKILLITFLTIILVDDEKKLRYLILVIALSLGFYGFKGGLFAIAKGGKYLVLGPERSFIADNTAIGIGLVMLSPFLFYLAKDERNWWFKRFLELTFALTIVATLFTYSRGAFLGLGAVLGIIFLGLRFRTKIVVAALVICMIPVALIVVPERWYDRMQTIETYEQDRSAMSRLEAWEVAWKLALDRPLRGGGFQIINDPRVYDRYKPDAILRTGVHSAYFEVLAENGFITFGLFIFLIFSCLVSLRKVKRVTRAHGPPRFFCYAQMLQASLIGYAVSATFMEFASFDLFYHVVALVIVLKVLSHQYAARFVKQPEVGSVKELASA